MRKKPFFYAMLFFVAWMFSTCLPLADWDYWARIAVGKIFFQTGHVLKNDIFSFTLTKPILIDHEWGSGVIFYFFSHNFGDKGIFLFKILILFLIFLIISKIIKLQNSRPDIHMNIAYYIMVGYGTYNGLVAPIRCQCFTFLFFVLWIYVLERIRRGENRLLWIFPATMLIWANLHGGFVSGLGLLFIYGVGEFLNGKPFKKYFLIAIPSLLVTLINPYGYKYLYFIVDAVTMPRVTIYEWMPTKLFSHNSDWMAFKILFWVTVITQITYLIKNKLNYFKLDKVKLLLISITAYMALQHIKHQALFILSAACFTYHDYYGFFWAVSDYFINKYGQRAKTVFRYLSISKDTVIYTFIALAAIVFIPNSPMVVSPQIDKYPVGSVEFIKKNNLHGNVFTVFHWGSYVAWKLYPQCYIAEDGRYEELYPENLHLKVYNFNYVISNFWYDFVRFYHTDILIIEKANRSYPLLKSSNEWKDVYEDKVSAVFLPANKVKKYYIKPKLDQKIFDRDKYVTSIDF